MRVKSKKPSREPFIKHHKDGSIWAKGTMVGGVMVGYWEWFRKDGSRMRSGYFDMGVQTGEWTTYDKEGKVYKVTDLSGRKPKNRTSD